MLPGMVVKYVTIAEGTATVTVRTCHHDATFADWRLTARQKAAATARWRRGIAWFKVVVVLASMINACLLSWPRLRRSARGRRAQAAHSVSRRRVGVRRGSSTKGAFAQRDPPHRLKSSDRRQPYFATTAAAGGVWSSTSPNGGDNGRSSPQRRLTKGGCPVLA